MIFKLKPKFLMGFSIFLGMGSISFGQDYVEDLDFTVAFLAGLNSRITGYPGSEKAAKFIEDKLIEYKLGDVKRESFDMTSLAPIIFQNVIQNNKSIYFIGTKVELIDKAIDNIKIQYP
ncbi:MAG: hypothetical protein CME10_14040, partial [Gemmatimonadetes bacterium]|nr:hypothetical protein [Gemmatimonadota bacterium]